MATATNTDNKTNDSTGFKIPKVDTNAVLDSYKKNLEILGLINKMSIEVCNGIAKLQAASAKQFIHDLGGITENGIKPSNMMAKFSEIMRDSMVKIIGNNKQISDLMSTYNNELTVAIAKKFKESASEAKTGNKQGVNG
ncbi:MAG: hypothetical protein LBC04_00805 [Holosporaceae bacterium]|nr:hypothetical protein [Holosporaceae bacterium]